MFSVSAMAAQTKQPNGGYLPVSLYKSKRVNSSYGSMDIDVPQDRKSTFEPQIVKKHQKALFQTLQFITSSRKSNYPFRSVKCLWKIHSTNHAFRTKIGMRYDNFMIL